MKVVFLAPYSLPLRSGGFESQVYHIFSELISLGVDVMWYNYENFSLEGVDILQVMATDPSMLPVLRQARAKGVKIVMTPMQGSKARSTAHYKRCLQLSRIPQFCTGHKMNYETIRCANHLTPLCSFEAERLVEVYGFNKDNITVIPNGLDKAFFDDSVSNVSIPCKDYLLVVGRIEENKNQLTLIEVAKALNMELIIVGESSNASSRYLEKCLKAADKTIYFWGLEKNISVIKQLYRNAKLTVIPSFSEMVPLVAFESLSQHTPVVCTNRCGIAGDDIPGLCFSNISKHALIKSITEMCRFKRGEITNKGIYTWSEVASMYKYVYERV